MTRNRCVHAWPVALALIACATSSPATSAGGGPPDLRPPGTRLFHEVEVAVTDHGEHPLLGTLTFPEDGGYRLIADTPFGVTAFEVGFDGRAYGARVAAPLEGRFPAEGLAHAIWRIYGPGCPAPSDTPDDTRCAPEPGWSLLESWAGMPSRPTTRTWTAQGGSVTRIEYRRWRPHGGFEHPEEIVLRAPTLRVRILLTGFERLPGGQ